MEDESVLESNDGDEKANHTVLVYNEGCYVDGNSIEQVNGKTFDQVFQ